MANNLDTGNLETKNFPKKSSDSFYEKWQYFTLKAFTVFVQFKKD